MCVITETIPSPNSVFIKYTKREETSVVAQPPRIICPVEFCPVILTSYQ